MTKTEARKLAKACRAAVDLHTVGHAMAGVLFALPAWQRADTVLATRVEQSVIAGYAVLAFASMPDEPDTADILRQALAESKRLLLPRVLSRTEMDWVEITALSQLQPGAYGILEAPASLPAFDTTHLGDGALALIPCLATSPDGVRLGRGGGYYDRFLAHYKGRRLLVCPTAALLGDLPCEGWDVRFSPHEILTEKGILL